MTHRTMTQDDLVERAKAWPGSRNGDGLSVGYTGELIDGLAEALQSLTAENIALEARVEELEGALEDAAISLMNYARRFGMQGDPGGAKLAQADATSARASLSTQSDATEKS